MTTSSPLRPALDRCRPWAASWLAAFVGLAAAMPAGCADLRSMPLPLEPEPRSGTVVLSPGEMMSAQALERALRKDAASLWQRSDAGAGLIVHLQEVTWRDGALGCPQPDRTYTQALVPGWHARISDGSRQASYHASRSGFWLLCPADRVQPPLPDAATS